MLSRMRIGAAARWTRGSAAAAATAPQPGWLVGATFDSAFIVGIAGLALTAGFVVVTDPRLFGLILFLDLWLLGYHHVISTYTRLCFDRESFAQHRFLILHLPLLVFAATVALAAGFGLWALVSVYIYWQWFHYTRQSWGIAQSYRRKADVLMREPRWFATGAFYLVPLWGIAQRSAEQPGTFIGLEVRMIPVPTLVADAVGIAACVFVALWIVSRVRMWREGSLVVAHTLYLASHFAVFAVGYILIEDMAYGWLVVNIWHNLQYIVFTWLYNNRRFKAGVTEKAAFLSRLSQTRNLPYYFLLCLAISTLLYGGIAFFTQHLALIAIPAIVIWQTINFHHYIVDALIWKVRRPAMRRVLGLGAA